MKKIKRKFTIKRGKKMYNNAFKIPNAKIGSTLRIRLPSEYSMTREINYQDRELKKWCIEQSQSRITLNEDGNVVQLDIVKTAQEIYDWVNK